MEVKHNHWGREGLNSPPQARIFRRAIVGLTSEGSDQLCKPMAGPTSITTTVSSAFFHRWPTAENEECPTLDISIGLTLVLKIVPTLSKGVCRPLGSNYWANQCNDNTGQRLVPSSRQPRETKFVQT